MCLNWVREVDLPSIFSALYLNSVSKLSHPIFWLPNFNLTLILHQILSFPLILLILISTDRKFCFAFESIYQVKITYTT